MSEKLPYEEQLDQRWDDLPLPDENMAWKDMKRRLDEDDDEKIIVPPPRRGCGIGALLIGLLLLGGLWLLVRPEKWFMSKEKETTQQTKDDSQKPKADEGNKKEIKVKVEEGRNNDNKNGTRKDEEAKSSSDSITLNSSIQNTSKQKTGSEIKIKEADTKRTAKGSEPLTIKDDVSVETKTPKTTKKKTQTLPVKKNEGKDVSVTKNKKKENILTNEESVSNQKKKNEVERNLNNDEGEKKDSTSGVVRSNETKTEVTPVKDPVITKKTDTLATKKPGPVVSNTKTAKEKVKENKPIFFAAGVGLHQQIPIAGQEWTSYGSLGRKGTLSDYIPSINFRMEKQDRWFLQSEFRYGAPQHTKQFTYNQTVKVDTPSLIVTTNSLILKKTFYHQVPITFNYYVLPNWSVGTGVQWNRFSSAVAEESVSRRLPGSTNDSLLGQKIVKISTDSSGALVKSWMQGVIQTQYQWKRFSIGARYSFGLQPYIKFKLPNQPLQEEKNSSLQIFLRYELWRSKK